MTTQTKPKNNIGKYPAYQIPLHLRVWRAVRDEGGPLHLKEIYERLEDPKNGPTYEAVRMCVARLARGEGGETMRLTRIATGIYDVLHRSDTP